MESSPPTPLSEDRQATPSDTSQATIDEGLSVELRAAPLFKRTLAYCVDWVILGVLIVLGTLLFSVSLAAVVGQVVTSPSNELLGQRVVLLLVLVLLRAYISLIHGYFIYSHL